MMTKICPSPMLCLGALLLVVGLHSSQPAAAQGLPPVNLGATSFLDGGPPAGAGVYLSQYFQYFDSNRFLDGDGRTIPFPDPDFEVWISLTQVIIGWDKDVVPGAKLALDITLPVVGMDLDFGAPGPFPRDGGSGLGDLLIGPALQFDPIMRKQGPRRRRPSEPPLRAQILSAVRDIEEVLPSAVLIKGKKASAPPPTAQPRAEPEPLVLRILDLVDAALLDTVGQHAILIREADLDTSRAGQNGTPDSSDDRARGLAWQSWTAENEKLTWWAV